MRKSLNIFSSIACSLMIASNKQRQKHNNLALICTTKLKEAHEHFKSLMSINLEPKCKVTLKRMNLVVIEDYYHVTTINENMYWMKLIHLLSIFSLNLRVPFSTSTFTSNSLIEFLNV